MRLSSDSSKEIITCGAKIKNISTNRIRHFNSDLKPQGLQDVKPHYK